MSDANELAIDVHGHYGTYFRDNGDALADTFMSASAGDVARRAGACGIGITIVSPLLGLLPRGRSDAAHGNEVAFREVPAVPGLLQYAIINPLQRETFAQARAMLKEPWCVGLKIHPEEHGYRISDHGRALFEFLEEVGAPAMTHSGCPGSLPADFVPFANEHPRARLLLAHLGNAPSEGNRRPVDLQVRAVQAAKHGNLWVDTSSSRSVLPNLIEWAVNEIGAERLMFGTDTPLYHAGMQKARIERADLSSKQRKLILQENAVRFFGLADDLIQGKRWREAVPGPRFGEQARGA